MKVLEVWEGKLGKYNNLARTGLLQWSPCSFHEECLISAQIEKYLYWLCALCGCSGITIQFLLESVQNNFWFGLLSFFLEVAI